MYTGGNAEPDYGRSKLLAVIPYRKFRLIYGRNSAEVTSLNNTTFFIKNTGGSLPLWKSDPEEMYHVKVRVLGKLLLKTIKIKS